MRIRRALTVFAALVCIATCLTASVFGQNIQRPDQKVDQGRRVEARIDPATGALSIEIPIRVYTGRGGMRIPISFSYSSKVWQMDYAWYSASPAGCEQQQPNFCTEQFSVHSPRFAGETASGWTIGMGLLRTVGDLQTYSGLGRECDGSTWSCGGASKYVNRLNLLLPDGSTHEFRRDDGVHTAPDETGAYYSVDGTGMRYEGGVLYLPDGSKHEATKHTDRNGNTLTLASGVWTDTLGRSFTLPQLNSSPSEGDISYVLPGIGGQNDSYTLKWRKLEDVRTAPSQPLRYTGNLGHSGQVFSPYLFDGNNDNKFVVGFHNPVLLSEIVLPNNETYKFTYNIHGEIDKITYPTGAYERFSHAQVNARQGLSFPYDQANRGVVERWVSPSGQSSDEQHWTYTPTGATSTVTQPDGMSLVSTYHLGRDLSDANRVFGFDDARAGKPKDEKVYASGGALKARTLSKWEQLGGVTFNGVTPDSRATRDPYLSKQISIVFETGTYALMQMTEYEYDSHSDPSYFAHLNVKRTKGYGFIPVPKTTAEDPNVSFDTLAAMFTNSDLVSVTETDYSYDSSYKARGILGRPVASRVMDPQNTSSVFAKSEYVYDEAAYFDGSYTTATNWENPNSTLRGNVTTTKTWHAETSSWIESHTMFDHFGNVTKVWDTSGDATRFVETQYDAVYKYAYSTKTKAPAPDPAGVNGTTVGSEINRVYDFTTGLLTSVTDAHGQTAYTEYNDALLRPTRIVPPSGGSVTETIYNDTPGNIWVKLRQQIDAHTWGERTTYFDNSGRALKSRTKDQQGDVVSEVRYDVFGRVEKTSNPYRVDVNGNPVETVYWSKVRYDEVNRVVETYAPAPDGQTGQSLGTAEFGISTLPGLVGAYAVSIDASGRKSRAISGTYGLMRVDEATAKEGTVDQDLGTLANPTQPTFYHYNIKGELARINQGTQDRYFLYDSLGRLIRVRQPEQTPNANLATTGNPENNQWTAGYTYDVFGNVTSVTDAKNITITNFYDKAGRTTKRTYSDGTPQVEFFYDGKGLPQVPQC